MTWRDLWYQGMFKDVELVADHWRMQQTDNTSFYKTLRKPEDQREEIDFINYV